MKRLSILRHAKSSWADRDQSDFDRPLNARGRDAVPLIGQHLATLDLIPDLILCSTAARASETLDLMRRAIGDKPMIYMREDLYLAEAKKILAMIQKDGGEADHVMIIGHNPGLEMIALLLADPDRSDTTALTRLAGKFPTAALAQFTFGGKSWRDLERRSCELERFVTPKDLTAN